MALEVVLREGTYPVSGEFRLRSRLHGRWNRRKVQVYGLSEELDFPCILRGDLVIHPRGSLRSLRHCGQEKLLPLLRELVRRLDVRLATLPEQKDPRWWELFYLCVRFPEELPMMSEPWVVHYPKDGAMDLTVASFGPLVPQFAPHLSAMAQTMEACILARGYASVAEAHDAIIGAIDAAPHGRPQKALRMFFGIEPEGRNSARWIGDVIGVREATIRIYIHDALRPLNLTLNEAKYALGLVV